MANVGLTSGEAFLRDAAKTLFEGRYERPRMHVGQELHRDLQWTPALRFTIYGHVNVFVEPSENGPYPRILELKYADVRNFPEPIAIYAVCPENMISTTAQRADMKRLKSHGHGLVIVDRLGNADLVFSPTPVVQVIPSAEFKREIAELPIAFRRRVSETFEEYQNHPTNGVKSLSEIVEGLVQEAAKQAARKTYISIGPNDSLGRVLSKMQQAAQFSGVRGEIGGVQVYRYPRKKKESCHLFNLFLQRSLMVLLCILYL